MSARNNNGSGSSNASILSEASAADKSVRYFRIKKFFQDNKVPFKTELAKFKWPMTYEHYIRLEHMVNAIKQLDASLHPDDIVEVFRELIRRIDDNLFGLSARDRKMRQEECLQDTEMDADILGEYVQERQARRSAPVNLVLRQAGPAGRNARRNDDDDDDEPEVMSVSKKSGAKKQAAMKKPVVADDDDADDEEPEPEVKPKKKPAPKKKAVIVVSDDDDDTKEEEPEVKPVSKPAAAKKKAVIAVSNDDDSKVQPRADNVGPAPMDMRPTPTGVEQLESRINGLEQLMASLALGMNQLLNRDKSGA